MKKLGSRELMLPLLITVGGVQEAGDHPSPEALYTTYGRPEHITTLTHKQTLSPLEKELRKKDCPTLEQDLQAERDFIQTTGLLLTQQEKFMNAIKAALKDKGCR